MTGWKPRNLGGRIYYDPRDELLYWASTANGPMVAVPVLTLHAASALRECKATTVMTHDEDGPLNTPLTITCRKPEGHDHDHYNGYASWSAP